MSKLLVLCALLLMPITAAASAGPLPEGIWQRNVSIDASTHPQSIEITTAAIRLGGSDCRIVSQRQLHERRWYVDVACADSENVELDLLLVDDRRMMVARRILGTAETYVRRDASDMKDGMTR